VGKEKSLRGAKNPSGKKLGWRKEEWASTEFAVERYRKEATKLLLT
jgi:hypothetical protein